MLENILVVLRFHYGKKGSVNPIISQTMGRVAVINHAYQGPMPQAQTFWLCRLDRQHNKGNDSGCFIVTPLKPVPEPDILRLIPGMYDVQPDGNTVICNPKVPEHYWIAPFSVKKFFLKKENATVLYQSVIVPVKMPYDPPLGG